MSTTTEDCLPDALPPHLQLSNWPELETEDGRNGRKVWQHYERFLLKHGYHILGSHLYNTLGTGVTEIPLPPADPFHPKDHETFIYHYKPRDLHSIRISSIYPVNIAVFLGIDRFLRQVVFKALMYDSKELKILRTCRSPPLCEDICNRVIPILEFLETRDFVIAVMPCWGRFWYSPPCGNMTIRLEMAIKIMEGLVWLHEQGIAHGDLHISNIVESHDYARERPMLPESDYRKNFDLQYAFIDFEAAHIIPPGHPPLGSLETIPPDDFASPEQLEQYRNEGTIDVFAADVYNLGKTLEFELKSALQKYGKDLLQTQTYQQYQTLLLSMTNPQPDDRPTMANVLSTVKLITTVNGENDARDSQ